MNNDERIKQVAKIYGVAAVAWLIISPLIAFAIVQALEISGIILVMMVTLVVCFITEKIMGGFVNGYVKNTIYQGDLKKFEGDLKAIIGGDETPAKTQEAPQDPVVMDILIVGRPEKPIAKYMDVEIFEWLDLKGGNDIVERFFYFGTCDSSKLITVPEGCIVIRPGLIYRHSSMEKYEERN